MTVVSIAAIAISLTVATHEGVHALACLAVGGDLQSYSALYVSCDAQTVLQRKVVAGSAPFYNLLADVILWLIVRGDREQSSENSYFLWLSMLMQLLYGSGYFMFSGVAGVGDIANLISGWEPVWLWRVLMTVVGSVMFMACVWLALCEFGKMVGGEPDEQIGRASKLSILSYVASLVVVVLLAGLFNPLGFSSLPVVAGLVAVLGGLLPLLWMMQWFQAKIFPKLDRRPLEIHRRWGWITSAIVVVFLYAFVLGRTLLL